MNDEVKPEDWHETKATVEASMRWWAIIPVMVIGGIVAMIIEAIVR